MLQVVIVYMGLYQHWALLSDRTTRWQADADIQHSAEWHC